MINRRTILTPRRSQVRPEGFVAVRAPVSGQLLGFYNPQTHQWLYDDGKRREVVDLPEVERQSKYERMS